MCVYMLQLIFDENYEIFCLSLIIIIIMKKIIYGKFLILTRIYHTGRVKLKFKRKFKFDIRGTFKKKKNKRNTIILSRTSYL